MKIPKPTKRYTLDHKGVTIEAHQFQRDYSLFGEGLKDCWTYYLHISPDRVPDKNLSDALWLKPKYDDYGKCSYDYNALWISDIHWHGGVTWYSKESCADDKMRRVKIGCDFSHYWDEEYEYNIESVIREAIITAEEFIKAVPDYKRHCNTCGGYWLPSEGIMSEDGLKFISPKGIKWTKEHYPDSIEKQWWREAELAKETK